MTRPLNLRPRVECLSQLELFHGGMIIKPTQTGFNTKKNELAHVTEEFGHGAGWYGLLSPERLPRSWAQEDCLQNRASEVQARGRRVSFSQNSRPASNHRSLAPTGILTYPLTNPCGKSGLSPGTGGGIKYYANAWSSPEDAGLL